MSTSKNLNLDFQSISHFEIKMECWIWETMGQLDITPLYHFRARDPNSSLKILGYVRWLIMS